MYIRPRENPPYTRPYSIPFGSENHSVPKGDPGLQIVNYYIKSKWIYLNPGRPGPSYLFGNGGKTFKTYFIPFNHCTDQQKSSVFGQVL